MHRIVPLEGELERRLERVQRSRSLLLLPFGLRLRYKLKLIGKLIATHITYLNCRGQRSARHYTVRVSSLD